MVKGQRILSSGYSNNKCLLTVMHSWGVRADSSQFEEEEDGQESSLLSPSSWCWKDSALPVSGLGVSESEARARGEELLAAACLLPRSRPLPPGNGLPHHLSSGTTCCFSCMATTRAWDKMVSRSGRDSGHNNNSNNNNHITSNPWIFRKTEGHIFIRRRDYLLKSSRAILWKLKWFRTCTVLWPVVKGEGELTSSISQAVGTFPVSTRRLPSFAKCDGVNMRCECDVTTGKQLWVGHMASTACQKLPYSQCHYKHTGQLRSHSWYATRNWKWKPDTWPLMFVCSPHIYVPGWCLESGKAKS